MYQIYTEKHMNQPFSIVTHITGQKWNSFSEDLKREDLGHPMDNTVIGKMFPENDKIQFDL